MIYKMDEKREKIEFNEMENKHLYFSIMNIEDLKKEYKKYGIEKSSI